MTPNKLPPLPERVAITKLFAPWFIASLGDLTDDYAAMTLDDVEMALLANGEYILPIIEALRHSQSLPAGAVAGLVGKWRAETKGPKQLNDQDIGYDACLLDCADELEQALQADARERGEACRHDVFDSCEQCYVEPGTTNGKINGYLFSQRAIEVIVDGEIPAWMSRQPGIRVTITPEGATQPAQASEKDNE